MLPARRTIIIHILFLFSVLYAQSKKINSLELDFSSTTEFLQDERTETFAGSFFYEEFPFNFTLHTTFPEEKISTINSNTIAKDIHASEQLLQTCKDFLLWFTDDFGLQSSGFVPYKYSVQDKNSFLCEYRQEIQNDDAQNDDSATAKALVFYDDKSNIRKIQMYDKNQKLISQAELISYCFCNGYYFPDVIYVKYFDNANISGIKLSFKNIKVNNPFTKNPTVQTKDAAELAATQSISSFSIPSVVAMAGYSGYKKFITKQDASACRFEPSCSQFMLQAIKKNGIFGIIQGIERLERCTKLEHNSNLYPTDKNGRHLDPVPEIRIFQKSKSSKENQNE